MTQSRILYICPCWPHGLTHGGQLRTLHLGRALQRVGEVTLAVVSPETASEEVVRRSAAEFGLEPQVLIGDAPNRGLSERLRWALDPRYLNVHGCAAQPAARARLLSRLQEFDLIWVLNSRTPNLLQHWHWPQAVLDMDDVPSTFHRTVWRSGANVGEKLKAGLAMLLQRRRERLWLERFTLLTVCSEADRAYLGGGPRVRVIPNGFERPRQSPERNPVQPPRLGFIGLYSYPPNREGVEWFVREVWPQILKAQPEARFRLAGKDSDGAFRPPRATGIEPLGWLADAGAEMATWSAMVIPVRQGAGTRVKLADAFSRKCPVVATSLGAFGYAVQPGRELLLADDPRAFARACLSLMTDPVRSAALAERAYAAFLQNWTWEAIAPRVWAAAEEALGQKRFKAAPFNLP